VGRVAGALVFVKWDEHMNGVAGVPVETGRLEIIIGSVFPSDKTWADSLTFSIHFVYKDFMQQINEIKTSLKREYDLYSNAMAFYKNTLKAFEQKHQLSTQAFLRKFESGRLGDDADYFDWYAFAKLLAKWRKAQSAIRSAIQ
jgi:hypothetical protein